jgi:DNA polymerase-4
MEVFRRYTPLVEPLSLDEAFLDVAGSERLHGPPTDVAAAIRTDVLAEEKLTCSVGVAPNKFLAKLASEQAKPSAGPAGPVPGSGVHVVPADSIREFLDPLPVEAVWGVGPRTLERLQRLGVATVRDLRQVPEDTLVSAVGQAAGTQFWRLSRGIDNRPVDPDQPTRSIGHEETFARDLADPDEVHQELVRMVDAVGRRLREVGVAGRTVTVKLRYPDFTTISRSQTLSEATDLVFEILEVATGLLDTVDTSPGLRLLGVSMSGLRDASVRQLRLEDVEDPGWRDAEEAVERIRKRFGTASIGPAATVGPEGLQPRERGDGQWGPDG